MDNPGTIAVGVFLGLAAWNAFEIFLRLCASLGRLAYLALH